MSPFRSFRFKSTMIVGATVFLGYLCFTATPCVKAESSEELLNVVLLLADDLGWSDLGCYGADLHETPRIDAVDGESLVPLLKSPEDSLDRPYLCWHYPHDYPTTTPVSAIRSGAWKMLEYYEDSRVELYHLENDLSESEDLSQTHPEMVKKLQAQLHRWLERQNAQMPKPRR